MSLLQILENGLFALGQVLRLPVIALLWASVLTALFLAGRCSLDLLARRRERQGFELESWLIQGPVLSAGEERLCSLPSQLQAFVAAIKAKNEAQALGAGGFEHFVLSSDEAARSSLRSARILTRVGPSLGLLGTLIPMGSALAAMASGNLEAMAGQMVVAFTTTVVGLACGTVGYVIHTVRQGWVNETIREQRYLAEKIAAELGQPT